MWQYLRKGTTWLPTSFYSQAYHLEKGTVNYSLLILFRISCFGAILIWVRLLKFLSAFKRMGPLIAILKSLIEDIIKYFILYGVFFIPYTICFFVLFGGVQSDNLEGADDLTTYPRVAVMCFRMSLIDDYPFEVLVCL